MEPLVSIIVPVYRVERYLDACVKSLLNQTWKAIEIILVDDGSDDNCPEMCENYADAYERIRVVHQKNSGPSAARNAGIRYASGQFIAFCDSDDSMKPSMIRRMMETAVAHRADIVMCGYETFPNGKVTLPGVETGKILSPKEFVDSCTTLHSGNELCFSWRFLFKKQFVEEKQLCFHEQIKFGEDVLFNIAALMEASRIYVLPEALYYYRIDNDNSIMRSKYKPELEKQIRLQYEEKLALTKKYGLGQTEAWASDMAYYYITAFAHMLFRNALNGAEADKKNAIKRAIRSPMLRDNYRIIRNRKILFRLGTRNAFFWIACTLKLDRLVCYYVMKYF